MPNELKRHFSWLDAVSGVVGIVIGAGIFVTPQELARLLPSKKAMTLAWLVSDSLEVWNSAGGKCPPGSRSSFALSPALRTALV